MIAAENVADVEKRLAAIIAREVDLLAQKKARALDLQGLKTVAARSLIDENTAAKSSEAGARFAKAHADFIVLEEATAGCRAVRIDCIAALRKAKAAALYQRASDSRAKLVKIEEGRRAGVRIIAEIEAVRPDQVVVQIHSSYSPMSARISDEISAVEGQIERLLEPVPTNGVCDIEDATSVEQLVMAALGTESAAPRAEEISSWAEACEYAAGSKFEKLPRRYRLSWKNGEIDLSQSYTFVPSLARQRIGEYSGAPAGYDTARATFRAPTS